MFNIPLQRSNINFQTEKINDSSFTRFYYLNFSDADGIHFCLINFILGINLILFMLIICNF